MQIVKNTVKLIVFAILLSINLFKEKSRHQILLEEVQEV